MNQYLHWHPSNLRKGAVAFFYSVLAPQMLGQGDYSKQIQEGKDNFAKAAEFIDKNFLANRKFLCGDYPTFADLQCAHETFQLTLFGLVDVSIYPNFSRWLAEIEKIPSTQTVLGPIKQMVLSFKK